MLEVSDLHMVEIISGMGSLTRAAEALNISQPTLSKRLARLEQQLGTKLFEREATGLTPTLIAEYLIDSTAQIKANMASVQRQVERLVEHDTGNLRIGVGPIIEQVLLPPVLTQLAKRTGSVRLSIVTDRADILLEQLKSGQLDVIAGPYNADDAAHKEAGLEAIDLIRENTINVARVEHPIFNESNADFFAYPYASPPVQGTMTGMRRPTNQERARVFADNYSLLKSLILESDYICGGPQHIFASEIEEGRLKVIEESPSVPWQSACLTQRKSLDTPLVKLFVNILMKERDRYLGIDS